jgi:hypothetical protein
MPRIDCRGNNADLWLNEDGEWEATPAIAHRYN